MLRGVGVVGTWRPLRGTRGRVPGLQEGSAYRNGCRCGGEGGVLGFLRYFLASPPGNGILFKNEMVIKGVEIRSRPIRWPGRRTGGSGEGGEGASHQELRHGRPLEGVLGQAAGARAGMSEPPIHLSPHLFIYLSIGTCIALCAVPPSSPRDAMWGLNGTLAHIN